MVGIKSYSLKVLDRPVVDDFFFSFKGNINREGFRNSFAVLRTLSMLSCFLMFFLTDICIIDVSKTYKSRVDERDKRQHTFEFWREQRSGILQNLFESLSTGFVCDGFLCGVSLQKLKSKLNWQNCKLMAFPSFCWDVCLLSYCLH